jgi:hypothetical protein
MVLCKGERSLFASLRALEDHPGKIQGFPFPRTISSFGDFGEIEQIASRTNRWEERIEKLKPACLTKKGFSHYLAAPAEDALAGAAGRFP